MNAVSNCLPLLRTQPKADMPIEESIKQRQFKHAYHKLALNLMYTNSLLKTYLKDIFKEQDITPQQYNILRILRGSRPHPLSTMQIRERMMDRMSDTSRIVDRLIIKKLVSKKVSAGDNRLVDVTITDKGMQLLQNLDGIEDELTYFLGNLSEAEAEQLSDLLDKINERHNL